MRGGLEYLGQGGWSTWKVCRREKVVGGPVRGGRSEVGVPGRVRLEYLGEWGWNTWRVGLEYLKEGANNGGYLGQG